jgi:hypothetical protein
MALQKELKRLNEATEGVPQKPNLPEHPNSRSPKGRSLLLHVFVLLSVIFFFFMHEVHAAISIS